MTKTIGPAVPNLPWEERAPGCADVVWRYSRNPIIPADLLPTSNSIFNSPVVPFQGAFAGVFRCDDKRREMQIHSGRSADGLNWSSASAWRWAKKPSPKAPTSCLAPRSTSTARRSPGAISSVTLKTPT